MREFDLQPGEASMGVQGVYYEECVKCFCVKILLDLLIKVGV